MPCGYRIKHDRLAQLAQHSREKYSSIKCSVVLRTGVRIVLGGELDTEFVLSGIFSDANPAPQASAETLDWFFPDGSLMEYTPSNGAVAVTGIQTEVIKHRRVGFTCFYAA